MQLGIRNDEAAALAETNDLKVVMNRCPKIEYGRLSGEIGWAGRAEAIRPVEDGCDMQAVVPQKNRIRGLRVAAVARELRGVDQRQIIDQK